MSNRAFLYDIDIKSHYWPWTEEGWLDLKGYIIRVYSLKDIPRGFTAFKVGRNSLEVSKICVSPIFRRIGLGSALMKDLVLQAITLKKTKLCMTIHEHCEYIEWLVVRGWEGKGIESGLFPDGSDGYLFERGVMR
jgi:GNAT superfamily N-acetyltransferase